MFIIYILFCFLARYSTNTMIVSAFTELPSPLDLTYDELKSFQTICSDDIDNCRIFRDADDLDIYTCMCEETCVNLRTCCVDSPYRDVQPTVAGPYCKSVSSNKAMFVMNECPRESPKDSIFSQECAAATEGDLLSFVPVTSSATGITYKNYFCFKCNENHDDFVYWSLKLATLMEDPPKMQNTNIVPVYDRHTKQWLAEIEQNGDNVSVAVTTELPPSVSSLVQPCVPNVISDCAADWDDDEIRQKCKAYTAFVTFTGGANYRNPHCAMCNFEDIAEMNCYNIRQAEGGFGGSSGGDRKKPFSFTHLLDINRSDGNKVGEIQKCEDDSIWDPFFNKCRTLKCALPGYYVKNGKCTAN